MENSAIQKINKLGRIGVIVIRVIKVISVFILAVFLIGLFTWGYIPKGHITLNYFEKVVVETGSVFDSLYILKIKMNNVILDHSEETENGRRYWGEQQNYSLDDPAMVMLLYVICFAVFYVILRYGGKLCKAFRTYRSPFDPEVISNMKKLEIAMIPWALISIFTDTFATVLLMKGRPSLTVNINLLLPIFILYTLLFIFQYGAQLQQESDETI